MTARHSLIRYVFTTKPPSEESIQGGNMEQQHINITIVTYNRLDYTRQCLNALLARTPRIFRLNIIDNNSTDGTRDYLSDLQHDPNIQDVLQNIILLNSNMGIAPAYNLGWSLFDAQYYIKMDNDVVVLRDDWLDVLIHSAERVQDVAMLGFGKNTCNARHILDDRLYYAGHIGGCALITKKAHEYLGFWNEDYGLYGEEDADFGLRARLAGFCNLLYADTEGDFIRYADANGSDNSSYTQWKSEQRKENINSVFRLNDALFKCGFRDLRVERKYKPVLHEGVWSFPLDKSYLMAREQLFHKYEPHLQTILQSEEFQKINDELLFNFYY